MKNSSCCWNNDLEIIMKIKKRIKELLLKKFIYVDKYRVFNARKRSVELPQILYDKDYYKSNIALFSVHTSKCRAQIFNDISSNNNPYVKLIEQYRDGEISSYSKSPLEDYYIRFQPRNASELLNLNNDKLQKITAYSYVLPWENQSLDKSEEIRNKVAIRENLQYSDKLLGVEHGHTDFGPVSKQKGEIEYFRTVKLYNSIKSKGYNEKIWNKSGIIMGNLLLSTNNMEWCFYITSGKHRAYSLSALNFDYIPVGIDTSTIGVIRDCDVKLWPNVQNGLFTENEALNVFNSILSPDITNLKRPKS